MKKRFFYSFAIMGAMLMMACGGGQTKNDSNQIDTTYVPTDSTDEVADVVMGTDASFFDLKGGVESCRLSSEYYSESYSFDENGGYITFERELQKIDGVERDEKGRITTIHITDDLGRGFAEVYEYDEQGRIRKASCDAMPDGLAFELVYTYDKAGRVISKKGYYDGPGNLEYVYNYKDEDAQGNWTLRERLTYLEDEEEPVREMEKREIEYRK